MSESGEEKEENNKKNEKVKNYKEGKMRENKYGMEEFVNNIPFLFII